MKTNFNFIFLFFCISITSLQSQTKIKDYEGQWEGSFENENVLNLSVSIKDLGNKKYDFFLYNKQFEFHKTVTASTENYIEFTIDTNLSFTGVLETNDSEINGFISSGFYFYHIKLVKDAQKTYHGNWDVFMLDKLLSKSIFLSIENVEKENFDAYPFFGDQRFAGTNCMNSQKKGNSITFEDMRTGLHFEGKLLENSILLNLKIANTIITSVALKKSKSEWIFGEYVESHQNKIKNLNDGWEIASLKNQLSLSLMEDSFTSEKLVNTHSVLIAKKGKIIYDRY